MERIQNLIDKLAQQYKQKENVAQMLMTVQLLQQELVSQQQKSKVSASGKVAVIMPVNSFVSKQAQREVKVIGQPAAEVLATQPEAEVKKEPAEIDVKASEPVTEATGTQPEYKIIKPAAIEPLPFFNKEAQKEVVEEKSVEKVEPPKEEKPEVEKAEPAVDKVEATPEEAKKEVAQSHTPEADEKPLPQNVVDIHFDAMEEAPTLLQQQQPTIKELHELISDVHEPSLNDKLKQEQTELAHVYKDTPIKDLKKAIGINDKFAFIDELFRGDEVMYERSIKTINSFHVLQEAEYWINRELKVKLGWNDSKETVQHFYHLVRRRFA